MKQCPRCSAEVLLTDKSCPKCGLPITEMGNDFEEERVSLSAEKREQKRLKKEAKKKAKLEKKLRESKSDTDFSRFATNSENQESYDALEIKRNKKAKKDPFKFELDENGEFNIDTKDVELVGEEMGKIIEERSKQSYSVKKARGDYKEPKIKWWEIYKLADRAFARRKIKKEIAKASKIKPSFISKFKLLMLSLFLGWCGAHNFYAKNKKKGFVSLVCLTISVLMVALAPKVEFISKISFSVGGCAGFIFFAIWISDTINIIFNNFRYRIQIDAFIDNMNVKTRAKLGEKYIDLDLYHKPWWVRFKVWCQKKKRNYEEWKHERRQKLIQKEKEKLVKQVEQDKIDADIAEFERKENEELKKSKQEKLKESLKSSNVLNEIEIFENENKDDDKDEPKQYKQKKAKVSVKKKNTKK